MVQRRRLELGLTQEQLAERVGDGARQAEISRLEHDRIGLPRRHRLERLAAALDLSLGELLAGSGWAGADAVTWTPQEEEVRDHADTHESLDPSRLRTQSPSPFSPGLTSVLETARQTSARTHSLLERSGRTYDQVCRSVSRESSANDVRDGPPSEN